MTTVIGTDRAKVRLMLGNDKEVKISASPKKVIRLLKDFSERLYEDQTEVMKKPNENHPQKDKLSEWQVYQDILQLADKKGDIVKIEDLEKHHGQGYKFYLKNLPLLVKDGLIEWV